LTPTSPQLASPARGTRVVLYVPPPQRAISPMGALPGGAKASASAQYMPSEMHAELQTIACMSSCTAMPRLRSATSILYRLFRPPVTNPSGLIPYSSGELPPTGASMIQ
jgi:hypothetical protein